MNIRIIVVGLVLAMSAACSQAQTAGQDMKNAGSHTKAAAQDAGSSVSEGSKKAYHSTKRGTKKPYRKTKNKVERNAKTN